jgi:hypothetical protein|tara:strand:- start:630 stop:899 length:270 start_codon:yes stop_codon:yes gene_type:complete
MEKIKIIPSRRWKNSKTGETASITSAAPYHNLRTQRDWNVETRGFTVRITKSDGTVIIGAGYPPFETHEEVSKFVADYVNLFNAAIETA